MKSNEKQYIQAREAMVDSQIHPMGVTSDAVLAAFAKVPREEFVPEDKAGICYCDEDIEIAPGRYLMEPSVLARMIQAADLHDTDVVLTIGSGIGYNAAILSQIVSTVVALEENEALVKQAQASWDKLSYCNIAGLGGKLTDGEPKNAPYDAIVINGAVNEVPDAIKAQLSVCGQLIVPVRKAGQNIAKATLIKRLSESSFSETILFDAGTPYLAGFEPKKEFVF